MKALIADADRISRAVLKRLLARLDVESVEADNGLAALALFAEADPDFIVLDGELPVLSGPDALSAIRRSTPRPDLPVVCVSASGDRELVRRMIDLGVADYLLKPVDPEDALARLRAVTAEAALWRQNRAADGRVGVLLVDADPEFLAAVRPLLEPACEVRGVSSSHEAAVWFREARVKPSIVCLAEGLLSMNEDMLAEVIRNLAVQEGAAPPKILLLVSGETVSEEKRARYADVIHKTTEPVALAEELRRVVLSATPGPKDGEAMAAGDPPPADNDGAGAAPRADVDATAAPETGTGPSVLVR